MLVGETGDTQFDSVESQTLSTMRETTYHTDSDLRLKFSCIFLFLNYTVFKNWFVSGCWVCLTVYYMNLHFFCTHVMVICFYIYII